MLRESTAVEDRSSRERLASAVRFPLWRLLFRPGFTNWHRIPLRLFQRRNLPEMRMTWAAASVNEIAARWRMARRLYPIYSQIDRAFELGTAPCRELESPIDRLEPEIIEGVNHWFHAFDEKIRPHHVRHILQTAHLANEENLRDLLNWQLANPSKNLAVRDKID